MMTLDVLDGVVAWVVCYDPKFTAKPAIQQRLQQLGAKVVGRLSKDVTHIVYERRQSLRSKAGNPEAELQELYSRADKLDSFRPFIVSPSWVEESRTAKKRLVERKYVIPRPKEVLLIPNKPTKTPGSSSNTGKKRKQAAPPKPKSMDAYELGELFSSSQQIREITSTDDVTEVSSPRTAKKRIRWKQEVAAIQDAKVQGIKPSALEHEMVDTPGTVSEEPDNWDSLGDDLDTPLSLRLAKSASRSASKEADRRHGGRSRLAQASGPAGERREEDEARDDSVSPGAEGEASLCHEDKPTRAGVVPKAQPAQRFSVRQLSKMEEKPLLVHKGTPLPGSMPTSTEKKGAQTCIPVPTVERVASPWQEAEQLLSQTPNRMSQHAPGSGCKSAQHQGLLEQTSTQRKSSHLQLPAGCSPSSTLIPTVPAEAPWSTQRPWDAAQLAQQRQEQEQRRDPGNAGNCSARSGACKKPSSRPSVPGSCPRSVLRENVGAAAGNRQSKALGNDGKQQRPGQTGTTEGAAAGSKPCRSAQEEKGRQLKGESSCMEGRVRDRGSNESKCAMGTRVECLAGPSSGCIAITSVDEGVTELVKAAVRRLRGLRLCPEGQEDGAITHLVIGTERRTLKLMLAVANGAWLMTPEWVTASLEAGVWLPESRFQAQVRFKASAEKARSLREDPNAAPLLQRHRIYLHAKEPQKKCDAQPQAKHLASLKRLALALGAKVAPLKGCTICVVVGGGTRPEGLPTSVHAVKEDWLLMSLERFVVPSTSARKLALP